MPKKNKYSIIDKSASSVVAVVEARNISEAEKLIQPIVNFWSLLKAMREYLQQDNDKVLSYSMWGYDNYKYEVVPQSSGENSTVLVRTIGGEKVWKILQWVEKGFKDGHGEAIINAVINGKMKTKNPEGWLEEGLSLLKEYHDAARKAAKKKTVKLV